MPLVVPPGVGDGERLEDAADRLPRFGPQQEVEVVGHQAVAEEPERVSSLGGGQGLEEREMIGIVAEDIVAVIAAVERVIHEAVVNGAW